jgi:hypothetical protein
MRPSLDSVRLARMTSARSSASPSRPASFPGNGSMAGTSPSPVPCLMFVGVGVGYYGLPIFLKPLKDSNTGGATTQVSWAPAIYFCMSPASTSADRRALHRPVRGPTRVHAHRHVCSTGSARHLHRPGRPAVAAVLRVFRLRGRFRHVEQHRGERDHDALVRAKTCAGDEHLVHRRVARRRHPRAGRKCKLDRHQVGWQLATPILGALVLIVALPVILGVVVLGAGADGPSSRR